MDGATYEGDNEVRGSKMLNKGILEDCNNLFITSSNASFSVKDAKCSFDCAIFYKVAIIYAVFARASSCATSKEAEAGRSSSPYLM